MGKENIARAILSEQSACDVDVRTIVSFFYLFLLTKM